MAFKIKTLIKTPTSFKFVASIEDKIVGRIYLYLIRNDLHQNPYGLLEDLFVKPKFRHQGIATALVETALEQARESHCYKVIGTSRFSRQKVHLFYEKYFGFQKYGYEFRLDL